MLTKNKNKLKLTGSVGNSGEVRASTQQYI